MKQPYLASDGKHITFMKKFSLLILFLLVSSISFGEYNYSSNETTGTYNCETDNEQESDKFDKPVLFAPSTESLVATTPHQRTITNVIPFLPVLSASPYSIRAPPFLFLV